MTRARELQSSRAMRTRMLDRLQSATRPQCEDFEAGALALVGRCTVDELRAHLGRCYGFEAPLESACALAPMLARHTATSRPRTRYIARDLVELGISPERLLEVRPCPLSPFRSLAQALGWLYVAERNVLTNNSCHRVLASRAPELAARETYLDCYGPALQPRWQRFGIALERAAAHAEPEHVEASAIESYGRLRRWLLPDQVRA